MDTHRILSAARQKRLLFPDRTHKHKTDNDNEETGYIMRDEDTRTLSFIGGVTLRQLGNFHSTLLNTQKKKGPITLFITSYGGDISSAMAIYDLIKGSPDPITTVGYGFIESAGLLIYLAGAKRLLLPHTRFMFHWGIQDICVSAFDEDDLKREHGYLLPVNHAIRKIIEENTNLTPEQVKQFLHDFKTLSAEEAIEYGLAHGILQTTPNNKKIVKPKK